MVVFENNLPYFNATINKNQDSHSPFGSLYGYNDVHVVNVHNTNIIHNQQQQGGGGINSINSVMDGVMGGDQSQLIGPLQPQQQQMLQQQFPSVQQSDWNGGVNQLELQSNQQPLQQNEIQPYQILQQNQQIPPQQQQQQQQQQYTQNRNVRKLQENQPSMLPPQSINNLDSPSHLVPPYYNNYQTWDLPEEYHHPFAGHYHQVPYLLLSSFLGIIIGDLAELEALRLIGARRILMVYTIKPFAAALLGNILLSEPLYLAAFVGMILTALGVYFVIMGSLEKLEETKKKQKAASLKRSSDGSGSGSAGFSFGSSFHGDDDRSLKSFDTNSTASDEEIMAIISAGGGGGGRKSTSNHDVNNFQMVGLRRRPLSRHDLTADFESDDIFAEDDANDLMMLLEDGRGIIDTTICCGGRVTPPSSDSGGSAVSNGRGGGSWDNSWAEQSFDSVGSVASLNSLEKLDVDVMVAMENFEYGDDEDDDNDIGMNLGNQRDHTLDKSKMPYEPTNVVKPARSMKRDDSNQDKPLKSALRQSKYGGQSSTSLKNNDDNNQLVSGFPMLKKSNTPLPPSLKRQPQGQNEEYFKKKDRNTVPRTRSTVSIPRVRSSGSIGSMSSMGSFVSFESECGPPPGLYTSNYHRESKNERKIRIRTGYVLATLNVTLDAYCSYLTKKHGVGLSTWEINLCRLGFAGLTLTAITFFMRYREHKRKKKEKLEQQKLDYVSQSSYFERDSNSKEQRYQGSKDSTIIKIRPWYRLPKMSVVSWTVVSVGVFFVTFLSPALANYSLFQIPLALSISLTSITPLFTIPLGILMKGERPNLRGCTGAVLSTIGVVILCIWGVDSTPE